MNPKILRAIICLLILGYVGIVIGQSHQTSVLISQQELLQRIQTQHDMLLIDVRTDGEFGMGHIPGAVNIPHTELTGRLDEVRAHHEKGVILYCESGGRAGVAERILREAGLHNIRHLEGDMAAWRREKFPIASSSR